jgi:hypothetical protein
MDLCFGQGGLNPYLFWKKYLGKKTKLYMIYHTNFKVFLIEYQMTFGTLRNIHTNTRAIHPKTKLTDIVTV